MQNNLLSFKEIGVNLIDDLNFVAVCHLEIILFAKHSFFAILL